MKTNFVLFIMLNLLFGCASSPVQTQMSAETNWTLCLKVGDHDPECNTIDLRDYARIDADQSIVQVAQKLFGSKDDDKINYHWERLALIGLKDHISKNMSLLEIVNHDNKNRTWELKPR